MKPTRPIAFCALSALLASVFLALVRAQDPAAGEGLDERLDEGFQRHVRPFILRHCGDCHGRERPQGELTLTAFTRAASVQAAADVWDYVVERVRAGEMPPEGEPAPGADETREFLAWVEEELRGVDVTHEIDPGRPIVRRLSNTEYRRSVLDLVGVDFDVEELFPSDEVGHGYDNVGAAQNLPDDLLEKYIDAARAIAERAVVVEDPDAPPRRYDASALEGKGSLRGAQRVLSTVGTVGALHRFPRTGEYVVRVRASAQQAGPEAARMAVLAGDAELGEHEVAAVQDAPEVFELRARIEGGERRIAARFLNDYYRPEDPDPTRRDRNLWVQWIEVQGPLDPPPRTAFQSELLERFGADLGRGRTRAILEHLVLCIWRRPAERTEVRRLELLVADEATLEGRLQLALQVLLASPHFLFKVELESEAKSADRGDGPAPVRDLTGFELATSLAYFLWGTTPDEALLSAAARGELDGREGRDAAVTRMLADPRSRALADGFAAQWLQLGVLAGAEVDPELFPDFDDELRASMARESTALFDAILREGGSVWDLVDADYTFADERLARHYGLEPVAPGERLSLSGTTRRGLLGHAGILTLTSDPTRTSPVKRGKWVLDVLVGAPPPPPPPGVGALDESPAAARGASMRERLEVHRTDSQCAVCHARMDPLGFGLEVFDGIGAERTVDAYGPIDASGELPGGRTFSGPLELVEILRADDRFLENLVHEMFVYALGRGLERTDRFAVQEVLRGLDPERPTLAGIVRGIVHSAAFTQRRIGD